MNPLQLDTRIQIDATAQRVWEVFTNFGDYPRWNPFILEVQGAVRVGAKIRFRFQFLPGMRIWTNARVLRFEPDRELCWKAHFLGDWLFNGEHSFSVAPLAAGGVEFHHQELFGGIGLLVLQPILRMRGPAIYQGLNRALKQQVENIDAQMAVA